MKTFIVCFLVEFCGERWIGTILWPSWQNIKYLGLYLKFGICPCNTRELWPGLFIYFLLFLGFFSYAGTHRYNFSPSDSDSRVLVIPHLTLSPRPSQFALLMASLLYLSFTPNIYLLSLFLASLPFDCVNYWQKVLSHYFTSSFKMQNFYASTFPYWLHYP